MTDLVNVLVVEDSEDDYLLLLRELKKSNFAIKSERVEDAQGLNNALNNHEWDIIISDNTLPQLNAPKALQISREKTSAPFLIVSGTINEADAVNAMKMGASDYIFKGNLKRLVPAFKRELQELEKIKRAETALLKSEKQFKALTDSIGDVFFALDEKLICIYWNSEAERFFHRTAANALHKPYDELFPAIPNKAKAAVLETIETGLRTTTTFEMPDKNMTYFEMVCYPFNGGVSIIMEDITSVKKTALELHKVNIELETFMYRLSHDLKGPVASMIGLIELAKRDLSGNVAAQYCDMMSTSANTLKDVLESLLDVTKIKRGELNPEDISLKQTVDQILTRFAFKIQESGAEVIVPPEDLIITNDPVFITSILHNLIENGIKYGGKRLEKPLVTIEWEENHQEIIIRVKDNGHGIPETYQTKIFEMFYRANETKSGTGLGLYIVKSAVTTLEGKISVESSENGSIFIVTLDQTKVIA